MSREIEKDFQSTVEFFRKYTLETVIANPACRTQMKCMHRKLFSFMVFINEMERIDCLDKISLLYFKEVCADLLSAYFCWVNGAYKSVRLHMRSSIENFLKATSYSEEPEVIEQKSVYEVFNITEKTICYSDHFTKLRFNILSSSYSNLCATVHGALEKLHNIGGLIKFPEYDGIEAKETSDDFNKIIGAYLGIVYFTYYKEIFQMHELNIDLFLKGMPKHEKATVYKLKVEKSH